MYESEKQETKQKRQTGRIKKKTTDADSSVSSDTDYFIQTVTDRFQAKKIRE